MPRDAFAEALRGFGPAGLAAILVIVLSGTTMVAGLAVPLGGLLALAWARASRTPFSDLGYTQPRNWLLTSIAGVTLGVVLKLGMKSVVMPLLGAEPINTAYQYLVGNHALLPAAIWAMMVAGFGEETVFRGFLFERLRRLLGTSRAGSTTIVVLTSALFGVAHYAHQGLDGAVHAGITGAMFGTMYVITGRIWMPMIAHAAFDLTALGIIYWGLRVCVSRTWSSSRVQGAGIDESSSRGCRRLDAARRGAQTTALQNQSCFLLFEIGVGQVLRRPADACRTRVTPASTFKVPHALAALDAGVVSGPDEKMPLRTPGTKGPNRRGGTIRSRARCVIRSSGTSSESRNGSVRRARRRICRGSAMATWTPPASSHGSGSAARSA